MPRAVADNIAIMGTRIIAMTDTDALPKSVQTLLCEFDKASNSIMQEIENRSNAPAPKTLYHYTNATGLKGILESGTLWASDISSVNDPSEVSFGISELQGALDKFSKDKFDDFRKFAESISKIPWQKEIANIAHFFICSMNHDSYGDDLSQWRAYGNNGRGYALEFDGPGLVKAFGCSRQKLSFIINYNEKYLKNTANKLIECLYRYFVDLCMPYSENKTPISWQKDLRETFNLHAIMLALFFKHCAYRHENEYRLMQIYPQRTEPPAVKIRMGSDELIKYREIEWKKHHANTLKRIIVGPAADYDKSYRFVRNCVEQYYPGTVEICHSTIPYRP